jgi:hypothetical protein
MILVLKNIIIEKINLDFNYEKKVKEKRNEKKMVP